jgi:hypothetical protein
MSNMDWRTILKFDENLYRHTNDETKEKHRRILEFIGKQPKGKRLGNKIKDFVETGELDESLSPLDLPRNNITANTREFYGNIKTNILLDREMNFTSERKFTIVRKRVSEAVNAAIRILNFTFRDEVPADQYDDLKTAISRLIRYYYYEVVPNYAGEFIHDLNIRVEGELRDENAYDLFITRELFQKFDETEFMDIIYDCVHPVLMVGFLHGYPNRAFTTMMGSRKFRKR